MEFADGRCCECGAEFGEAKPKRVTNVKEPYTTWYGRHVEFVAPCPSCSKKIPLCGGIEPVSGVEPEPVTEAEPAPEAEPESETPPPEE